MMEGMDFEGSRSSSGIRAHARPLQISLIFAIVLGFASMACSVILDLGGSAEVWTGEVPARLGWIATGLEVQAGDLVSITYDSGAWSPWPGGEYDALGFGGDPRCRCNVLKGVSHAALIGRIGENEPFLVGTDFRRRIAEQGELYLGINDVDLQDNAGALRVSVEVHR